jgi:hypothetical protein
MSATSRHCKQREYDIHIPASVTAHKFKDRQAALGKAFWTHCRGCSTTVPAAPGGQAHKNWGISETGDYCDVESKFICDDTPRPLRHPGRRDLPALFSNKHFR